MPFSIPTTLNIASGIVSTSAINKSVTLSEENVHQVNVVVTASTTNLEVFLDITDLSKVKSLFLTTSSSLTYKFSTTAVSSYTLSNSVMLLGGSAESFQELTTVTGGTLVVGQQYFIKTYVAPDNFSNVGAATSGSTNLSFIATNTTPTSWAAASTLVTRNKALNSIYLTNSSTGTSATFNAVLVISND